MVSRRRAPDQTRRAPVGRRTRQDPEPVTRDQSPQGFGSLDRRRPDLRGPRKDPLDDALVLLELEAAGGVEEVAARREQARRGFEAGFLSPRKTLDRLRRDPVPLHGASKSTRSERPAARGGARTSPAAAATSGTSRRERFSNRSRRRGEEESSAIERFTRP